MSMETMTKTASVDIEALRKLFDENVIFAFDPNGPTVEGMEHIKVAEKAARGLSAAGAVPLEGEREKAQKAAQKKFGSARRNALPTSCWDEYDGQEKLTNRS